MTDGPLSALSRTPRLRPADGRDTALGRAFVGRQAIFDRQLAVYGYELLYRRGHADRAAVSDADASSAEVALDAFLEFGLDTLVAERVAFINLTRTVLLSGYCWQLPPERVVLEILENQPCDGDLVREVRALTTAGYVVALDDFVPGDEREVLLPDASIVKIEIQSLGDREIEARVRDFEKHPVELVAERIETAEAFELCRNLGFSYFQGYFFARPTRLTGRRVPVERITALQVLSLLADELSSLHALTNAVAADLKLSYQVLRLVNSAYCAPVAPIDSLSEAVLRLGRERLRGWVSVMALSGVTGSPPESLTQALVRARMCETLGRTMGTASPGAWYTAGLLSALDLLFDAPMARLLEGLPLSYTIVDALRHRSGPLGEAVAAVIAFERGDWDNVRCGALGASEFNRAYRSALQWASEWQALLAA